MKVLQVITFLAMLVGSSTFTFSQEAGYRFKFFSGLFKVENVANWLEMSEGELENVQRIVNSHNRLSEYSALSPNLRNDDEVARQKREETISNLENEFYEALSTQQKRQLQFMVNYYEISGGRSSFGILSSNVVPKLELSERQQAEIERTAEEQTELYKKKVAEFNAKIEEFESELRELKAAQREELLEMLSLGQREKFHEMFGEADLSALFQPIKLR